MTDPDVATRSRDGRRAREQLLHAIPVTEQHVTAAGVPTAVLVGGDGPPLVLLHGPGEFALTWIRVIPDLVKTHRVIAPDLPGHGASGVGEGSLDVDRVLAWLGDLVEQTCPAPPHVAGHLLGGAIGARFSVAHGDALRGLVLVDTFGLRRLRPSPLFTLTLVNFLARPTEGSRDRFFRQCFIDMDALRGSLGPLWEPLMTYALAGAHSPDQKVALRSMMPPLGLRAIAEEELARIPVPTTLIWGRHDRQTPLSVAQRVSSRHGWPLHVIEGAGDDPAFEQPAAVVSALADACRP
ncbi:alpha/beta fold hydrolase [Nocardioides koreensis]|uniref:Alpha/beta fold hydrolase n=1 Tax=Nocardioides koreensis TaxID=433651 RepID=A0ABP5LYX1_9ACTN